MDEDGGGFFDGYGAEYEPAEWMERSDDYNVWEEAQIANDRESEGFDEPEEDDEDDEPYIGHPGEFDRERFYAGM